MPSARRSASATSSCTERVTARASRSPTPRASAIACAAIALDGGPRATLFSGDGRGEAHALARALGKGEPAVARLAARLRTRPLHSHGRIDDDVLARIAANGSAGTLGDLPGAATAALHGDPVPLARLAAASAPGTARQAAQAQASDCNDNAAPAPSAQIDGGPFTGATWRRALGLAACLRWPAPAVPDPVLPAGAALAGAPALVLAGELDVRAPTATLRKVAALLPEGGVRTRARGGRPAGARRSRRLRGDDRTHLPADARAREARLREPAGSGSRSPGVPAQPGSRARRRCTTPRRTAATTRRSPTGARPPRLHSAWPTRWRPRRRPARPRAWRACAAARRS